MLFAPSIYNHKRMFVILRKRNFFELKEYHKMKVSIVSKILKNGVAQYVHNSDKLFGTLRTLQMCIVTENSPYIQFLQEVLSKIDKWKLKTKLSSFNKKIQFN